MRACYTSMKALSSFRWVGDEPPTPPQIYFWKKDGIFQNSKITRGTDLQWIYIKINWHTSDVAICLTLPYTSGWFYLEKAV